MKVDLGATVRPTDAATLARVAPGFVVTGVDDAAIDQAAAGARRQMAFYASTPAYRPVLELHGWGDLQTELHTLSTRGEWEAMGHFITDEVLETFAVVGCPEEVGGELLRRYGDVASRVASYERPRPDPAANAWPSVTRVLRQPDPIPELEDSKRWPTSA